MREFSLVSAIAMISASSITFCVGIRSALNHKNQYWFWGGAGLVQDSNPESEYQEMQNKIKSFENILGQKPSPLHQYTS